MFYFDSHIIFRFIIFYLPGVSKNEIFLFKILSFLCIFQYIKHQNDKYKFKVHVS